MKLALPINEVDDGFVSLAEVRGASWRVDGVREREVGLEANSCCEKCSQGCIEGGQVPASGLSTSFYL